VCLVHGYNKANVLPFVLSSIVSQDYPKNRIRVMINFEAFPSLYDYTHLSPNDKQQYNNWLSYNIIKEWFNTYSSEYHKIDINLSLINESEEKDEVYWSQSRFEKMIKLKSLAWFIAAHNWANYILFFDADVVLTNKQAFSKLINSHKMVISPMLFSFGTYSNFWAGINEDGYYLRTEDYLPIFERSKIGQFEVPMVHSCVLIDLTYEQTQKLTFNSTQFDLNVLDDMISLALSASKNNITMIIDNEQPWGYIPPPIERSNLKEINQDILDLELLALAQGNPFPLVLSLEHFVRRPKKEKLNVDQIYVINLERRKDRYHHMRQSLNILGIEAIFWKAVDGKQLSDNKLEKLGIKILPNYLDPITNQPMSLGEIGCFLSHYNIWKDMMTKNYSKIIILEDDVKFNRNFKSRLLNQLAALENHWNEVDFVYLGRKFLTNKPEPLHHINGFVIPFYSYWTIGYLITANGVRKLLNTSPLLNLLPVDEYLPLMYNQHPNLEWAKHYPNRNLNALSVSPLLISPMYYIGDEHYTSDTSPEFSLKKDDSNYVSHLEL